MINQKDEWESRSKDWAEEKPWSDEQAYLAWTNRSAPTYHEKVSPGGSLWNGYEYTGERVNKVIFLPCHGEFGGNLIVNWTRMIDQFEANEKIVCCQPSQNLFFPSASGFDHSQEFDPTQDGYLCKMLGSLSTSGQKSFRRMEKALTQKYPDYLRVLPFGKYHCWANVDEYYSTFDIKPKKIDTNVDIVISGRHRKAKGGRNLNAWPDLISALKQVGYKVGVVGSPAMKGTTYDQNCSFDEELVDERAWDWDDYDNATVAMMQKAKLVITTNCGILHLAVLLRRPIILIDNASDCYRHNINVQRDLNTYFDRATPEDIEMFWKEGKASPQLISGILSYMTKYKKNKFIERWGETSNKKWVGKTAQWHSTDPKDPRRGYWA